MDGVVTETVDKRRVVGTVTRCHVSRTGPASSGFGVGTLSVLVPTLAVSSYTAPIVTQQTLYEP